MLVKVVETKEVTKEIQLPYCATDGYTFYRINADGSILELNNFKTWSALRIYLKETDDYSNRIQKVLSGRACDESEVLEVAEKINTLFAQRSSELVAV